MLALENVAKTFHTGADHVHAIRELSLFLHDGDFLTIIGSNGAGKSTLLNLIAGTILPSTGRISLGGSDITTVPAYKRARLVGRIVQDPLAGTAPEMTVAENLALAMKRHGRGLRMALPRKLRRDFKDQLARLSIGLESRLDCPVSLLSGGERQALAVLMATLVPPKLLLLDEHTAALDPANAAMIVQLTESFVDRSGLATLMVTHNMEQAIAVGNRLIMMHAGEVIHELHGKEKQQATVLNLVDLFSQRHVADDELLLKRVPEAITVPV
ncbi:ATP-binding cassette domain-containing protein [Candidatus Bipolaricaulota bacterium]|nr:ATP-binding cassette domain-containing protein [Candidatus Bipolaricaulota bacterium]